MKTRIYAAPAVEGLRVVYSTGTPIWIKPLPDGLQLDMDDGACVIT